MAQLELVLGSDGHVINLTASTLADDAIAQFEAARLVIAADVLSDVLSLPISSLEADPLRAEFRAGQEMKWDFSLPAGASLRITLDPSVSSSIELRRSGELFATAGSVTLDDDLPLEPPAAPTVQAGSAYVSIRFRVSLTAAAEGAFTHGAFGFRANAGTTQRFLLAYHHKVAPETAVGDSIREAFQHFVLPYTPGGAGRIGDGCFSEWEHMSKLEAGFEAAAGFGGALLGAKSASELSRSISSELGSIAMGIQPKFQAGASFAVRYEHADAFRSVLSGQAGGHVDLFVYKMDRSQLSAGVNVGASAKLNARVGLETRLEEVTKAALEGVVPRELPGRDELILRLLRTLPAEDLKKATAEAEAAIEGLIHSLDRVTAEASITAERIGQNEALLVCRFHRDGRGMLPDAFADALQGRLQTVAAAGVEMLPGSFVRDSVRRRTLMRLQLFGVLQASSKDEYLRFGEMVYDGDGVFRIRYTRGRETETDFFGRRKQIEFLFTATARSFVSGVVKDADVRLRIAVTDTNDIAASRATGAMLSMILEGSGAEVMARRMRDAIGAKPGLTTRVECTIAPSAFGKIAFTAFEIRGRRAKKLPHVSDAANYEAFARAVDRLVQGHMQGEGFPDLASTYEDWAQFNIAVNDRPDARLTADSRPNRRRRGNLSLSNWPRFGRLASVSDGSKRQFIIPCLEAGRKFMNSCEDLASVATEVDAAVSEAAFDKLVEEMGALAKGELSGTFPLFFGKAVLAALLERMSPASIRVRGPAEGERVGEEFTAKLEIA